MGTTAQKIQYLDGTKTLLKDTINLTGAGITNDTFRSYANKLKLGLINALNDNGDTIYSNLEKVSGKGSNLSLTPTYEAPMRNREIYGNTSQASTPSPSSPVPIQSVTGLQNVEVCGKNLCNGINQYVWLNTAVNQCGVNVGDTGLYIKVNGGTYTISTTTTQTRYRVACSTNEPSSTQQTVYNGVNRDNTSNNITIDTTGYNYLIVNATDLTKIQIEQGSTATTYEPYKGNTYEVNLGNIELNKIGDYEDSIKKSTGKNLFDNTIQPKENTEYTTSEVINTGKRIKYTGAGTSTNTTRYSISVLKDLTNYVGKTVRFKCDFKVSGSNVGRAYIGLCDANGQNRLAKATLTTSGDTISFEIPELSNNQNYLVLVLYANFNAPLSQNDYVDYTNVILTIDNDNMSYEPYGKVWYKTKNIGKVVLNGSENWSSNTISHSGVTYTQFYISFTLGLNEYGLSNYFTYNITDIVNGNHFYINGTRTLMVFPHVHNENGDITTISDFKTWLSTHNTTVLYQLATPIYEVITNTELINQLESLYNAKSKNGTTNITITSQDLAMIMGVNVIKGDA